MDKALERMTNLNYRKLRTTHFSNLWFSWQYMGVFDLFRFHCLLSALLCGSNMCTQVSSPVSKLEITRLLQPLYVFKSFRAHLRCYVFCSSVSKRGTHLAQTFLRSKRFFRTVCTLPSDMPVQLAISLTDNRASCSTTIFTVAMLALVTCFRPSRTGIIFNKKFPSFKSFNPPKTCAHWNGLRSTYTTQFIKYLLWIYIKPNVAFNIATNFNLQVHVPMSQVNWSVYITVSISIWNNSVS